MQVEMLKHGFITIRILESDILEFNISAEVFPVFFPGMECIPIPLNDFRRIHNTAFSVHQFCKTFNIDLNGCHRRNHIDAVLKRFHNANGIRHKH